MILTEMGFTEETDHVIDVEIVEVVSLLNQLGIEGAAVRPTCEESQVIGLHPFRFARFYFFRQQIDSSLKTKTLFIEEPLKIDQVINRVFSI